ncbi:MAG: peptidyl-prolyl cis-trans isomerase [FCB group bacterium]|nr:peptidyl-prolyl cis-trans isomerase [FCB group bacterium]
MALVMATSVVAGDKKDKKEGKPPVRVIMSTTLGDIVLELNAEKAPITVANFLNYADRGYFDGTIFHRVIAGFMIQGGGFTPDMVAKPTDPGIENEWQNGLKNSLGSIAMARRGRQPNSGTSQFFINVKDNFSLDRPNDGAGYAVFGKVVEGMDVVEKIKMVKTTTVKGHGDVPVEPVVIKKVVHLDKDGKPVPRVKGTDKK